MRHFLLATACLLGLVPVATFAGGDPVRGEKLFRRCVACHAILKDGKMLVKGGITGPNLYGVIGRVAGDIVRYV